MPEPLDDDPLVEVVAQLVRTTPLGEAQARRVVEDVAALFGDTVAGHVQRRHRELQRAGLTNDAIFERLAAEVAARRFRAEPLTTRQLRRLVYG